MDVSGGKFSAITWSIIVPALSDKIKVSELDDILKFVWKYISPKIFGAGIPELFGTEKTADKKGITVKSEEFEAILCAWIVKIFSPSFKMEAKFAIGNLSGLSPL